MPLLLLSVSGAAPLSQPQPVNVAIDGLRSQKGRVLVCMTRLANHFPNCNDDPDRRYISVAAASPSVSLGALTPGDYAIAIIHDENGNGRLDTFMGIPREGVGFSRNPVLRFGPPRFQSASFTIGGAAVRQEIHIKYFL